MPIFDQYEVEPSTAYSGSYLSEVMNPFGSLFLNTSSYRRIVIADSTNNQIIGSNLTDSIMPFSYYVGLKTKNPSPIKSFNNSNTIFSDETFYDSLTASPLDFSRKNVDAFVLSNFGTGYDEPFVTEQLNIPIVAPSSSVYLILAAPGVTSSMNSGNKEQLADNKWLFQFPYQSYFKDFNNSSKRKEPSLKTNNYISTTISFSNPASLLGRFNTNITRSIDQYSQLFFLYNNAIPDQLVGNNFLQYLELVIKIADYDTESISILLPQNYSLGLGNIGPNIKDIYKTYFGFAKSLGPNNIPPKKYISPPDSGVFLYNISIRGWKYGIYSSFPNNTKSIYRAGRFGQFRDLLEQRLLTATNNSTITKNLFFPIENTFVSGTTIYNQAIDYVTATNPDYNQYDSGIYDYYCRSGQPFFDRDNED